MPTKVDLPAQVIRQIKHQAKDYNMPIGIIFKPRDEYELNFGLQEWITITGQSKDVKDKS